MAKVICVNCDYCEKKPVLENYTTPRCTNADFRTTDYVTGSKSYGDCYVLNADGLCDGYKGE